MPTLSTGKIVEVLFEKSLETFESQQMMLPLVDFWVPEASTMQNADNFIWRTVQQQRPVISGWDLTGQETGIIEQTYPAVLGTPSNDFIEERADKMRDMKFWEDAGTESGRKQASTLNSAITSAMITQGSLHIRSNASSGYNFIASGQALMNARQGAKSRRIFLLNDYSNLTFGQDLAARQTLQGRPATTWDTGQIGQNVAEFDIFTGSFLPYMAGGASPNTTVTGNQSFVPVGGSVNATTGVCTNVDYRTANIAVAASTNYNIGDKVRFQNPGSVPVLALGLDSKNSTGESMTFTIVAKPDATTITVFPKPIALDDGALSAIELAYANINTKILNAALVVRLNTDTSTRTNLFWDRSAVEVMGGTIPADLFKQFSGKKVVHSTMKNGQEMYMVYDGSIDDMTFRMRLFTWYGITIKDPSRVGVATLYSAT